MKQNIKKMKELMNEYDNGKLGNHIFINKIREQLNKIYVDERLTYKEGNSKNAVLHIKKNKLVLLSKLLKDNKNIYKELDKNALSIHKFVSQRKIVEMCISEDAIDKYITRLENDYKKQLLNKEVKQKINKGDI